MNGTWQGGTGSIIETQDWLYDMGVEYSPYITSDENSDFQLVKGRRYFMDFDLADIPNTHLADMSDEEIRNQFIIQMKMEGNDPGRVVITRPAIMVLRITFEANTPLHILVIVALAVGVILVAAGVGYGFFVAFKGLGEAVGGLGELPGKISSEAIKNPIAVIAIIVAVGIFVLGVKW